MIRLTTTAYTVAGGRGSTGRQIGPRVKLRQATGGGVDKQAGDGAGLGSGLTNRVFAALWGSETTSRFGF